MSIVLAYFPEKGDSLDPKVAQITILKPDLILDVLVEELECWIRSLGYVRDGHLEFLDCDECIKELKEDLKEEMIRKDEL